MWRLFLLAAAMAAFTAAPVKASQLIDRNASNVKLAVNAKGEALLTYSVGGEVKHVLAWGAVNAIAPTQPFGMVLDTPAVISSARNCRPISVAVVPTPPGE